MTESLTRIYEITGFGFITAGNVVMIMAGVAMIYLAIRKQYEPLLLLPLGFGAILANIPGSGLLTNAPGGMFYYFYEHTVMTNVAPIMLFFGIGAMTDLGPLLARPGLFLISASAQVGQFAALLLAALIGYGINESSAIGIIALTFGISYTLNADEFLTWRTLGILGIGLVGFATATAAGVITAKLMNAFGRGDLNPLIGAAGLAAVPHSPRVVHQMGLKADPHNHLIMHAMGPNMGAVIMSSVVACAIYSLLVT